MNRRHRKSASTAAATSTSQALDLRLDRADVVDGLAVQVGLEARAGAGEQCRQLLGLGPARATRHAIGKPLDHPHDDHAFPREAREA